MLVGTCLKRMSDGDEADESLQTLFTFYKKGRKAQFLFPFTQALSPHSQNFKSPNGTEQAHETGPEEKNST